MSLQFVAHVVRALAVLPAPASPRRRTSHVSLSLTSWQPGLAVAPVRAAESSSPPAVPASAAGKAVVPDDKFSLAKVGSLGYFLLASWALFSSKKFCKIDIVALSFVFDKYCLIMN